MKDLSVIFGINMENALKYFDGEQAIFDEILKVAVEDANNKLSRLEKKFNEKNFSGYQKEAHSIKSSAAIFGVDFLSEHAKKHEDAAKNKNLEYITTDYNNLVKEYKKFISDATVYLGN